MTFSNTDIDGIMESKRLAIEARDKRIAELERIVQAKCAMLDQISEAAGYKTGEQFSGYGIIERLREQGRQS